MTIRNSWKLSRLNFWRENLSSKWLWSLFVKLSLHPSKMKTDLNWKLLWLISISPSSLEIIGIGFSQNSHIHFHRKICNHERVVGKTTRSRRNCFMPHYLSEFCFVLFWLTEIQLLLNWEVIKQKSIKQWHPPSLIYELFYSIWHANIVKYYKVEEI